MKSDIKCKRRITVILKLSEEEALWLHNLTQNFFGVVDGMYEDERSYEIRNAFFTATSIAKEGL